MYKVILEYEMCHEKSKPLFQERVREMEEFFNWMLGKVP